MANCRINIVTAFLMASAAFGCGDDHTNAKPDAPDLGCTANTSCAAPTGVCNIAAGACVECTATDHAVCTGLKPVCGPNFTCQCTLHSQCASNVCLPDGSCALQGVSNIAYVTEGGTGGLGTKCAKDAPCGQISTALDTKLPYIRITGAIADNVTVNKAQTVTLLADPGAKLTPKADGSLITVTEGSNLSIYDLELSGATGGNTSHGIEMPAGNNSTLTLRRVKILNNSGIGVQADGGTLNIFQSVIAENKQGGLNLINAPTFDIRNNVVAKNGSDNSLIGGIFASAASTSKLDFNTVVGNKASPIQAATGGIVCAGGIALSYNLVLENARGELDDLQISAGNCTDKSLKAAPAGAGFKNPAGNDYHLTANTGQEIRDQVDCDGNVNDLDGEPRPQGNRCEYGADEYQP